MKVFKYTLSVVEWQVLPLPKGARLLTVQMQHGQVQLWALVDPSAPFESWTFRTVGTGNEAGDLSKDVYVGTYQIDHGALVFHVFAQQETP